MDTDNTGPHNGNSDAIQKSRARRRLRLVLVALGIGLAGVLCTVCGVKVWGYVDEELVPHFTGRKPGSGPMFMEWQATDHGWIWTLQPAPCGERDADGWYLFYDVALNLAVVIGTGEDGDIGFGVHNFGTSESAFFCNTQYEVTVTREHDCLLIFLPAEGLSARVALSDGAAARLRAARCAQPTRTVLDLIVANELVPASEELRSFIERFQRDAPLNAGSGEDQRGR